LGRSGETGDASKIAGDWSRARGDVGVERKEAQAMTAISIDIVSDVICPWCFIGARRLDLALASVAPGIDGDVTYRPFLLDPSTPPEGVDLRARLRAKYGTDPERMFANVEAAARSSGIPLDFAKVRRTPSTVAAHTLLRHAAGKGTQRGLAGALFEAHFLEARDIGNPDVLAALAGAHGFEADEARELLRDEQELSRTRDEALEAAARGVRGVPFFVFAGRFGVSGAQPTETLRAAIAQAAGAAPGKEEQ
jgi:predicted DsbA family dithiol-disulfide isomerase